MTTDCQRCGYTGGVDEVLSGVGYLVWRLAPLSFWLGVARPVLRKVMPHGRHLPISLVVVACGVAFLLVVRLLFPGRITRAWYLVRGCPKCGGRRWSHPRFAGGFGL
jgi:hypothetical protein